MGETLLDVLTSGAALGGVLAVAATWSRAAGHSGVPHLGVGATAGVAVAIVNRATGIGAAVLVLTLLVAGAALGGLGARLHARVRQVGAARPGRPASQPLLADAAVLGVALALTVALRPALALPYPFGPLAGRPSAAGAAATLAVAAAGVWVVASRRRGGSVTTWALAGAATMVAAGLGSGSLTRPALALAAIPAVADTAGLAFRATAAALLGRASAWHAAAAGLGIGLAEGLLWLAAPGGWAAPLPAVGTAVAGLLAIRHARAPARAGR